MLLRLHGENKGGVGRGGQFVCLGFSSLSVHASLSDATSVSFFAKSTEEKLPSGMLSSLSFLNSELKHSLDTRLKRVEE